MSGDCLEHASPAVGPVILLGGLGRGAPWCCDCAAWIDGLGHHVPGRFLRTGAPKAPAATHGTSVGCWCWRGQVPADLLACVYWDGCDDAAFECGLAFGVRQD